MQKNYSCRTLTSGKNLALSWTLSLILNGCLPLDLQRKQKTDRIIDELQHIPFIVDELILETVSYEFNTSYKIKDWSAINCYV